jgi:putative ABC transport system substrate-binding protein
MRSTTPIPLVSWQVINDVIDSGLVQSIARPEGNMTGTAGVSLLFQSKILEILAAAVPGVSRVGVLAHASAPALNIVLAGLEDAASRLNLQLNIETIASGGGVESLEPAFTALSAAGVHALLVAISLNFLTSEFRPRIAELARVHRLPSASPDSAFPKAGGLLAYSPNRPDVSHRVAWYVDKILKGAKPADLPMERPSKYDLVLNLKTAQALGLTIPPSVLAQATEVIT